MNCRTRPVNFIIDTGSQLNVISEKVWKSIVQTPMDKSRAITMNDANGGSGELLGLVSDIPLKFGHISTTFNAYVAPNPPFEGLLGRPWQIKNKVGIREKDEGTYLTFEGRPGYPDSEVLVTPYRTDDSQDAASYMIEPQVWGPSPGVTSIAEEPEGDDDHAATAEEDQKDIGIQTDEEAEHDDEDSEDQEDDNSDMDDTDPVDDSAKEREARQEVITYRTLLAAQVDDSRTQMTRRIGETTIHSDNGVEFIKETTRSHGHRMFLLRDAHFFYGTGCCMGHMLVQVFPFSEGELQKSRNIMRRYREGSVKMIIAEGLKPRALSLATPKESYQCDGNLLGPWSTPDSMMVLHAKCGYYSIPFIVDTGSQVNCVNADLWKLARGTSREVDDDVSIKDVTGKSLSCIGLWDTPLSIGRIDTEATLYIVEDLAVPGILGRSWQQKHEFSLQHRPEGLYLGIRDSLKLHSYELLITSPGIQKDVLDRTFRLCAMTTVDQAPSKGLDVNRVEMRLAQLQIKPGDSPAPRKETMDDSGSMVPTELNSPENWDEDFPDEERSPHFLESNRMVEQENRKLYDTFRKVHQDQLGQVIEEVATLMTDIRVKNARIVHPGPLSPKPDHAEGQYLLQDVRMTMNGRRYRGHGVLHMVFYSDVPCSPSSLEAEAGTSEEWKQTSDQNFEVPMGPSEDLSDSILIDGQIPLGELPSQADDPQSADEEEDLYDQATHRRETIKGQKVQPKLRPEETTVILLGNGSALCGTNEFMATMMSYLGHDVSGPAELITGRQLGKINWDPLHQALGTIGVTVPGDNRGRAAIRKTQKIQTNPDGHMLRHMTMMRPCGNMWTRGYHRRLRRPQKRQKRNKRVATEAEEADTVPEFRVMWLVGGDSIITDSGFAAGPQTQQDSH
ncbi:hypothetical protein A0H81_13709 [Grifola frondosa]|uniref:Uncharacterized protein n=1 Tax=Grifola frondosa TaxID=5627 RepID=A0A1C7LNB2_GRIFR|nr:hypothetical protein A0H81_13709 [Grifola frondosa]